MEEKLTGFGCDGANVSIGNRGLKGRLHETAPWVQFVRCLDHRLELSLRDALKNTLFTAVDEMLMHVYYLYEKSPKKCRELEFIILELKACLTGTCLISHKVAALERMIELFGAYFGHIRTLVSDSSVKAADPSVKAADRQKKHERLCMYRNGVILKCY